MVTGATGFTGQYLLSAALDAGYDCHGTFLGSLDERVRVAEGVTYHACDLTDVDAVTALVAALRPHCVVHLAGVAYVAHSSARAFYDVNLWATVNLLDALRAQAPGLEKVLVASSANIYGDAALMPIAETAQPQPVNDYGVSKFAMELACQLRMDDLPMVIVRPFNYTGVGQSERFLIPKIVAAFRARQVSIELGNLDVARDFSDVRDVVSAYMGLLASDVCGQIFNICSGTATPLRTVIEILEEMAGYSLDIAVNPAFVRENEIRELYGDPASLDGVLGERPRHLLRDTLAWMLGGAAPSP